MAKDIVNVHVFILFKCALNIQLKILFIQLLITFSLFHMPLINAISNTCDRNEHSTWYMYLYTYEKFPFSDDNYVP